MSHYGAAPLYPNLPRSQDTWNAIVEPAKNAYWKARRNGKDETGALLEALDCVIEADRRVNS